jgi:PAS domain S-box-containing protein
MVAESSDVIHVLHVDDEPDFAELAAEFVERQDERLKVETTTRPQDGLDRIRTNDVDCVVSDHDMPDRSGIELLEIVRAEFPDLPFILYTGKGSEEVASDAISAGVSDYLQKESGTDQYSVLAHRIVNAVTKRRAQKLVDRAFRAMDRSREGMALLDENGEFIYINQAYTDIVGYEQDELIGEFWEVVYPDAQADRITDEILASVPEEGHWSGDTVYEHKDGTRVRVNHALAYSDDGTMICLIRNRSDNENQREFLHEERQRFELFIDAVEDYAIFMLDPDGYIISWNTGAERIKGYSSEEILGEHFSVFYTDEQCDAGLPERLLNRALQNGTAEHKGSRVRKDGSTFHADVVMTAVYDENEELRGFGKVTRNIEQGSTGGK